jgi:hypothetical protein
MSISTKFRTAAAATVLAGGLASAVVPAPASAAVTAPVLYAHVQGGNADCSYYANLQWARATDRLTGDARVQNNQWFSACRKALNVTFVDDEGNVARVKHIALPTACSVTDPTCSSGVSQPIDELAGVSRYVRPYIDHMDAAIVGR